MVVVFGGFRARFGSKRSVYLKSSGCKPDALFKLHFGCPNTLSSMFTLLRLVSSHIVVEWVGCYR